jgi:hypothetical protein
VLYGSFGQKELHTDLTGRLTDDGTLLYRFIGAGRLVNASGSSLCESMF